MEHGKTETLVVRRSTFQTSAGVDKRRALISFGSIVALIGFILSGPVGFGLVQLTKPQPTWSTAANFVANYHSLQTIPYYFGFVLIGGMLVLAIAHYLNAENESPLHKLHILLSVACTIVFAALIFFNYICQIAFVHHLTTNYRLENDTVIATLSMANPGSLTWAIEMWGYALLGAATWSLSAYYREKSKAIYYLLIANGIISILSAAFYVYDGNWLLTIGGLAGYGFWNILMAVPLILMYRNSKHPKIEVA